MYLWTLLSTSVVRCDGLNITSSNVSAQAGHGYTNVVYGACDSGWETPGGDVYFQQTCSAQGDWQPHISCQSMYSL